VQINLPAQNFVSNYYIDVPSGAQQLTVTTSSANGADVDLFVRFATPFPAPGDSTRPSSPQLVGEDTLVRWSQYHAFSASATETVSVQPSSLVPLAAGRWYVSVINSSSATASPNTTLTATIQTTQQVATIAIDFATANTDPKDTCDIAPWTDSTPVAAVGGN